MSSALGLLFRAPYDTSIATLRPFSRCTRPIADETPRVPPPTAMATSLSFTETRPNPAQRIPTRKSPDSVGVREPDHCTPNVFLPETSFGRLSSVSLILASVRLSIGGVFDGCPGPRRIPSL